MKVNDDTVIAAPARRTQAERTAATRALLIDAARKLFADKGFADVSTQAIVGAAGVTRGALYHQFDDKAALFAAVAIFVAVGTDWNLLDPAISDGRLSDGVVAQIGTVFGDTIPQIGRLLIRDFVLAFEIASVVLLAAIIGALALVRER